MASFNSVTLMGNLTRDPELRYTPQGTAVCDASLAINRNWTSKDGEKKEEVSFFDVVLWGKSAEVFAAHMKKGRPVLINGELRQERWEQDGQKRSRIRVHADRFIFIGPREGTAKSEEAPKADESVEF